MTGRLRKRFELSVNALKSKQHSSNDVGHTGQHTHGKEGTTQFTPLSQHPAAMHPGTPPGCHKTVRGHRRWHWTVFILQGHLYTTQSPCAT